DAEVLREGIAFHFVQSPSVRDGSIIDRADRMNSAVALLRPDVIHVNGIQFGRQAVRLKRLSSAPILIQDHLNAPPRYWLNRATLRRALDSMDAVSFVSSEQAVPWLEARLFREKQIVELMEGSSRFSLKPKSAARDATGLQGNPLCLWVG